MCDRTELLMFDILQELKKISSKIGEQLVNPIQDIVIEESKPLEVEKAKVKPAKKCKHCGKVHDRPVDYAICAKKHKKEGAK